MFKSKVADFSDFTGPTLEYTVYRGNDKYTVAFTTDSRGRERMFVH